MPANDFGLRLEQAYGRAIGRLWRQVAAAVMRGYDGLDTDDLAAAFRAFLPLAEQTIALGQQQAQAIAAAFLVQYVESQAGRAFRAEPVAADIPDTAPSGDPLPKALSQAVGVTWLAFSQGRPEREALGLGRLYVGRLAGRAVSTAAEKEMEHQAERSRGLVKGYEWVTVGDTCPACLSYQDGTVRPWSETVMRHNACDCQKVPAIVGVPDEVPRPTGEDIFRSMTPEQQAAIFKSAGEEKAALVREGKASLSDLAQIERTPGGRIVTEAPLEAVA